ncbi:UDP-glucose 4-epimerase GalE [Citricoccus sp. K5]|uniref:UDP-glucose 4-epimerase GalE n=1 Tax=Citricoccus sp. K5 TaxID=2653135 RepID=UPI00135B8231|nr:UDP-glucose 4-epimerase GalE [Citricoccus sp. K5]
MTWMVTGGAGYIGAHVVEAFRAVGIDTVVVDNLSSGHRGFVPEDVPFIQADLNDRAALEGAFAEHGVAGVVHIAGYKYAGESVRKPLRTYRDNVTGMVALLEAMEGDGVANMVFSSSAATFGTPHSELVTEASATVPESPYGETKLIGEWLLADQARAAGLRHTSLRYFNVVGSGTDRISDTSPHNLFPLVFDALVAGRTPRINGADYPTPDGTCVRDYIHVADLAEAHVAAARRLEAGESVEPVYNLGSGAGTSVREIMDAMASVTGIDFEPEVQDRRPGDPARIVADGTLAARDLGWTMRYSVQDMVASAWSARQAWEAQHTR